ncbi:MAG: glycosyltransferase family 39 protein [Selenomonadales bacterium]|nr:glycosyltransferase family 39 protein [Selenomonadales bacterium]
MNYDSRKAFWILLAIVAFNILCGIGGVALLDPDEPVYAETAKEMIRFHDYLSPRIYHEFWYDKPPIFYWLLVGSLKLFGGFTEFSARVPASLMAILSILLTYASFRRLLGPRAGWWSAMVMGTSVMLQYMGKASVTDTTLLFFMTAALLCFLHRRYWLLYVCCGLAVMTKGPIGVVFPSGIIFCYLLVTRNLKELLRMHVVPGLLLTALIGSPWYVYMYQTHGWQFIQDFLGFHNLQRFAKPLHPSRMHWWFYIPVVLLGMFPWTGLLFQSVKNGITKARAHEREVLLFLEVWAAFVFLFFSVAKTKQVSYMLVLSPALSGLIGWNLDRMFREKCRAFPSWAAGSGVFFALLAAGWILGGRSLPELAVGSLVLGVGTLALGLAILGVLLGRRNGEEGAWLHVATGLFTMGMVFVFLMPLAQDRFSVKTMALQYRSLATDTQRVLYVDKQLRPGMMLYTDIPGIEADTNNPDTLARLREDPRPKYILMRDYMYRKQKEEMGGARWQLVREHKGICLFKSEE